MEKLRKEKRNENPQLAAIIFQPSNNQLPTSTQLPSITFQTYQQMSPNRLISAEQIASQNNTPTMLSTSDQSSQNNSTENILIDLNQPSNNQLPSSIQSPITIQSIQEASNHLIISPDELESQFQSINTPVTPSTSNRRYSQFEIIDRSEMENFTVSNINERFTLNGNGDVYYKIIECEKLESLEAKAKQTENYNRQVISFRKQTKRFQKKIELYKANNQNLKDLLASAKANNESAVTNLEKIQSEIGTYKVENQNLKDRLASYYEETALRHMKESQTVIALKNLLDAMQLKPSDQNIKAELDITANVIQNIDTDEMRRFKATKLEKLCLHLYGINSEDV